MTGDPIPFEHRHLPVAQLPLALPQLHVQRTPRPKPTPFVPPCRTRRIPRQQNPRPLPLPFRIRNRHRRQQRLRVRMPRRREHLVHRPCLDRTAEVHHTHPVGDVPHHRQIVRDEEVRRPQLLLEPPKKIEHSRLDGDVQRGHRLVQHQQLRLHGQRTGDTDPLPLPAGELVRVPLRVRRIAPHLRQQLPHPPDGVGSAHSLRPQRLGDDVPDRHPGIERRHRVLEDDLDPPPQRLDPGLAQAARRLPEQLDRPALGPGQFEQFEEGRRLAGPRLADQRERLTAPHVEIDAVHGVHRADPAPEGGSPEDGEGAGEPAHLQHRLPAARPGPVRRVQAGHGRQQFPRVGLLGPPEHVVHRDLFDDPPVAHHGDPVGHAGDDPEIMADQQDGRPGLPPGGPQHVQDPGLDGDVERRGRFVGEDQVGVVGHRHGDHRALAHAAGELVRERPCAPGGFGDPDEVEEFDGAPGRLSPGDVPRPRGSRRAAPSRRRTDSRRRPSSRRSCRWSR